jgi:hypothetical protein
MKKRGWKKWAEVKKGGLMWVKEILDNLLDEDY